MLENLETMPAESIRARAEELKRGGFRFVTETACQNGEGTLDLFYSFDREGKLATLKATVSEGEHVRSLSDVYLAAAFVENEIGELFGLVFDGIAVDYGGHFILAQGAPETPFGSGVIIERREKTATGAASSAGAVQTKGGEADAGK